MVFLTKEEIIRRKRKAKFRFKALVRKVKINSFWLTELEEQKLGQNVKRNVAIIFQRQKSRRSILTILDKRILNKPTATRTKEEREKLAEVFQKLNCFKNLPPIARTQLANVSYFRYYEKDRRIIKEGHLPNAMYFILYGEVVVSKLIYVELENDKVDVPINIIGAGEQFGEIAMIYDCSRIASCTSATDCELLCVDKEDFTDILKSTLAVKHDQIRAALQRFEYFKNWNEAQIKECCILSRIVQYNPQQIIYNENDISNFSFFVLSGKCTILQCLKMKILGKNKYQLIEAEKKDDSVESTVAKFLQTTLQKDDAPKEQKEDKNMKHQFLDVGTYSCGSVFGISEEMENRIIIARNSAQCLLVPRTWLFQKSQNIGNVWQRIKIYLNSSIPSQKQLFADFLSNIKWKQYKASLIKHVASISKQNINETQVYNIPRVCRIEESQN